MVSGCIRVALHEDQVRRGRGGQDDQQATTDRQEGRNHDHSFRCHPDRLLQSLSCVDAHAHRMREEPIWIPLLAGVLPVASHPQIVPRSADTSSKEAQKHAVETAKAVRGFTRGQGFLGL